MLQNGNVTLARIIASTLVTVCCMIVSCWVISSGHPIPFEVVTIAIIGVGGVVGVDVVAAVVKGGHK